nr:hypothetical protein [Tanacetum cinerariifolium]
MDHHHRAMCLARRSQSRHHYHRTTYLSRRSQSRHHYHWTTYLAQRSQRPVYLPYVLELVYPEYMPPEDDVFPAEEQLLLVAATPTADSPGYIPESDPKGDLEEDDEEDPEEDPTDSTVVALPAVNHVPSEEKMAPKRTTRSTPVITTLTPETTTSVTDAQLQAMIDQGVTDALAARDANRNGDDSHTSGTGRPVQVARKCTYPDFLKCQPLNFKGTEGVVGLSQWFEKIESVYSISNCIVACQVKFATCTLQGNALTWWNSHIKITTPEAAHAMPWRTLKKMMTDKYCPRGESKKLESKM